MFRKKNKFSSFCKSSSLSDQSGTIPLLVILAAIGIMAFLTLSFTGAFKNKLYSTVFPKPPSQAAVSNFPLAETAYATPNQNPKRNNRSPFVGPRNPAKVKKLWEFQKPTNVSTLGTTSFVGSTIGQNNTVYFSAGMVGIYAVDTGSNPTRADRYKWHFTGDPGGSMARFIQYAPTIDSDGLLHFINEAGNVYALNPDGTTKWHRDLRFKD